MRFPKLADFRSPKRRLQFLLLGGAFLLGSLFFLAVLLPATSSPSFCGQTCHSMEREYLTWKRSSHSNITCTACHVNPGLVAFITEKGVYRPVSIAAEMSGQYEKPINSTSKLGFQQIPREVCERCHNITERKITPRKIFNKTLSGKGAHKYHAKHLKRGIPCTLCHNRVAHKDVSDPNIIIQAGYDGPKTEYTDGMNMQQGCFRCHSPFPKEHDKALIKKYKAWDAPKKCRNCHSPEVAPVEHALRHGEDWPHRHKKVAMKVGFKTCWQCHDRGKRFQSKDKLRSRCRDCHHRVYAQAQLQQEKCKRCHKAMRKSVPEIVELGKKEMFVKKDTEKAIFYRRMVYHKVHFPKKFKCTKCHLADLETTKKPPFELCKNKGCHPPGQEKPPSGSKLCKLCHITPHTSR